MPDVNVLIGVFRGDDPRHTLLRTWLETVLASDETFALTPSVAAGYLRIVTSPRIFADPTPLADALRHVNELREFDGVVDAAPGQRHWQILERLCRAADARGPLVADADHAATAIEHGATWVTLDRDFARFPGLSWIVPI